MRMAFPVGLDSMDQSLLPPIPPIPRTERQQRRTRSRYVEAALATAAIMAAASAFGLLFILMFSASSGHEVRGPESQTARSRAVEADVGVVAADHVLCSDMGVGVLKRGGNAIDAAVAVAFCQGVANPGASGIGGGDFMLLRLANGHAEALDMRETAPASAFESMYADDPKGKKVGGLAVAIPGQVKGLYEVWQRYGKLSWASLVEPTIQLATEGFPVPPYLASVIKAALPAILLNKGLTDVFAPNGVPLVEGDIYSRKKLAETLAAIAQEGSDAFYTGPIAKALAEDVQANGGILTVEDLENYRTVVTEPVRGESWGHTILGMPPPSSGGAGLIMILNILDAFKNTNAIEGDLGVHHIVEAFKHTYAVRAYLGDPLFENITSVEADMMSPAFAAALQKTIADNTTFEPSHYGGTYNHLSEGEEHGTSHFSIVDGERNAVSMTCTVNFPFGAKFISEQTGILLNNEMDDFATPEDILADGLPAMPNFIKPNKRPLSTMSPTIVLKNGQLRAVLGGSGGIRILSTVAQVLLLIFGGCDPLSAVSLPRVHHQFLPNILSYENYTTLTGDLELTPESTRNFLVDRGHDLSNAPFGAISQLVVHDLSRPVKHFSSYPMLNGRSLKNKNSLFLGKLIGVSDSRKDGYPSGY